MTPPRLDDALRDLQAALADATPPARVDSGIAQAIARAQRRREPSILARMFERWLVWPVALAASMFAISVVVRHAPPADLLPVADATASRAFLPLASSDQIAAAGDAVVVPTRLPRLALAQLGLPVDPARADQPVDAELLVRPDGAVLAFRFLP